MHQDLHTVRSKRIVMQRTLPWWASVLTQGLNTLVCRTLVFKALFFSFMQLSKLDQILGLEIQRRRIEKGWSQEYLAEVTGLHRTYISQLERGLKSPSVRVLSHITNALDITMGEFLRDVEELLSAEGK
jgi:DNA-binding XRE family transcriptional regulator